MLYPAPTTTMNKVATLKSIQDIVLLCVFRGDGGLYRQS